MIGSVFAGKINSIKPYGVFVDFVDDNSEKQSGLVHISEVSHDFVSDISTIISIGDEVQVKVLGQDKGKINLSIKQPTLLKSGRLLVSRIYQMKNLYPYRTAK